MTALRASQAGVPPTIAFRDFTAEEFLGRTLTTYRGVGGCVSVFQGSSLTLGQMAGRGFRVRA
jgi:hypothetical protein